MVRLTSNHERRTEYRPHRLAARGSGARGGADRAHGGSRAHGHGAGGRRRRHQADDERAPLQTARRAAARRRSAGAASLLSAGRRRRGASARVAHGRGVSHRRGAAARESARTGAAQGANLLRPSRRRARGDGIRGLASRKGVRPRAGRHPAHRLGGRVVREGGRGHGGGGSSAPHSVPALHGLERAAPASRGRAGLRAAVPASAIGDGPNGMRARVSSASRRAGRGRSSTSWQARRRERNSAARGASSPEHGADHGRRRGDGFAAAAAIHGDGPVAGRDRLDRDGGGAGVSGRLPVRAQDHLAGRLGARIRRLRGHQGGRDPRSVLRAERRLARAAAVRDRIERRRAGHHRRKLAERARAERAARPGAHHLCAGVRAVLRSRAASGREPQRQRPGAAVHRRDRDHSRARAHGGDRRACAGPSAARQASRY